MALVDYSDSEGSDTEQQNTAPPAKPIAKPPAPTNTNFSIDRANSQRIRVKLAETTDSNGTHEDEPAPKRARVGGGGFSGFNSLLPPPKRDADSKPQSSLSKAPARKVFSLKTGAEPGFSRGSDAELKNLFAEQDAGGEVGWEDGDDVGIPDVPKKTLSVGGSGQPTIKGNTFMFKPLSVARSSNKKKKSANGIAKAATTAEPTLATTTTSRPEAVPSLPPPKKVSLFSLGEDKDAEPSPAEPPEEPDYDPVPEIDIEASLASNTLIPPSHQDTSNQNLDSIASDLNLSAAERRQLFGRHGKPGASAANISNFNMDQEYLANEELRQTGEQVQHNPLRAIAPGKHSLKQLVSAAQGQKDALEESFAMGRRNKKEAGNKYGW